MQPKQFRNLMESARSIIHPIVENGDNDCPKHDHENEDTGHQEVKHKGKTCKEAHPGMEHEEWEMSQNESLEVDEAKKHGPAKIVTNPQLRLGLGKGQPAGGKVTVKTKSGSKEKVSRDDLQAAGDLYDRLKKNESDELDETRDRNKLIDLMNKTGARVASDTLTAKGKVTPKTNQAKRIYNKARKRLGLTDEYSATSDAGHKDAKWAMQVSSSKKAGIFNKPRSEYLKLAKKKLAKTKETTESKKHTVKTQSGTKETVSRDELQAAGDLYDRLKKREDVDYGLQDSTKETLGRFIENSLSDGNDIQEMKTDRLQRYAKDASAELGGVFQTHLDAKGGLKRRNRRKGVNKAIDRLATRKTRMYQGGERGSEIK